MSAISVIDQRLEREKQSGKFLYKVDEFLETELTLVSNVTATISVWVSACIVIVSSILYITAFATTGWGEVVGQSDFKREHGLWKYCGGDSNACGSVSNLPGAHVPYQVLAVLSLVSIFTSVVLLILYCIYDHMKAVTIIRRGVFFTRLISALFLLLTFSVFAGTWYKDKYTGPDHTISLSYSFALTVTTFVFECIASVLMGIEMKNQSLELKIQEQDHRVLSNSAENSPDRQFNQINPYSDDVVNGPKPYELFREFTQEETDQSMNTSKYYDLSPSADPINNRNSKIQIHNDVRPKKYSEIKNIHSHDIGQKQHYPSGENIYNEISNTHLSAPSEPSNTISVNADVHTKNPSDRPVERPSRKSKTHSTSNSNRYGTTVNSYENIPDGKAETRTCIPDSSRNMSNTKYQSTNPYVTGYVPNTNRTKMKASYYNQESVNANEIKNYTSHKAYDNHAYHHQQQEIPVRNNMYYNESNT